MTSPVRRLEEPPLIPPAAERSWVCRAPGAVLEKPRASFQEQETQWLLNRIK